MWGWTLMSESKPSEKVDNEASDELAVLRAQHTLSSSSTMESLARTRDRLDEESRLRSGIRRERRMRISEMSERLSGMHGAMRKANEIFFEDQIQQIEMRNLNPILHARKLKIQNGLDPNKIS